MKKLIAVFLAVLFVLVITGCKSTTETSNNNNSSLSSNSSSSNESENTDEKIEITYWYAWGDKIQENNINLVEMFNESQDRIHVTAEYQGTYDDLHAKTQAALAAGNPPHVTQNEIASMGVFARSGMTENLTPFIERDNLDIDDFNPGLMGNSYIDGDIYGLPYLRSTPILYLNATLLEEVGLDPSGPKTWEEFEEYSRKLTIEGERVGITMPISIWYYEAFVHQSGGELISEDGKEALFNSKESVEPVEFMKRLNEEGIIKVPTGDEAGAISEQDFANGRSAMILGSTAGVAKWLEVSNEQGFELRTTFMPANKSYGVPTGGCNLVMTTGLTDEEKDAAWEFIKWMTDKDQTIYASTYTGYLPNRLSAIEDPRMQELYAEYPQYKVAVDQLQYGNARPMEIAYPEIGKEIQNAIAKSILENLSPQEAMDEAAEKANQLLK
ncbi:ABC transporter substrate-binding protein [Alkalihalobacillus sp. BA299]|uniref:ABC transporter substrate-binding protein n=1 Tax=Alkalihalobacillus sp. BA299 TaxID=2815938 RepID=UPI001ADD1B0A|nr:ABC transporter substrate-binding protein [Alkalihalobacillus sp. BA299]